MPLNVEKMQSIVVSYLAGRKRLSEIPPIEPYRAPTADVLAEEYDAWAQENEKKQKEIDELRAKRDEIRTSIPSLKETLKPLLPPVPILLTIDGEVFRLRYYSTQYDTQITMIEKKAEDGSFVDVDSLYPVKMP